MGFEIIKGAAKDAAALISDRDLHLAADEKTILEASDPKSATVLVGAGGTIPGPTVARLGLELVDGKIIQKGGVEPEQPRKSADDKSEPDKKAQVPHEDKSRKPDENKGGGKK